MYTYIQNCVQMYAYIYIDIYIERDMYVYIYACMVISLSLPGHQQPPGAPKSTQVKLKSMQFGH